MMHVLLVSADLHIKKNMSDILSREGIKVSFASNGNNGLRLLDEDGFDVIFLDVNLEDISCSSMLKLIKEKAIDTPIIAISGDNSLETERWIRGLGIKFFLLKPFREDIILSLVRRFKEMKG